MAKTAELYDGTQLEFPDDTPDDVIAKAAARETDALRTQEARKPLPAGVQPSQAGAGRGSAVPPDDAGLGSAPAAAPAPAAPAAETPGPGLARRAIKNRPWEGIPQVGQGRGMVNPVAFGEPQRPDETVADFAARQPGTPDPAAWNTPGQMQALSVAPAEREKRLKASEEAVAQSKNTIKAVPEFGQGVAEVARAVRGTQSRGSVADAARDFAADAITGSAQGMAQFNQGVGGLERGVGEASGLQKLAQFGEATARAAEDFQHVAQNPRGNTLTEQAFGSLVNNVALLPFGRGTLPLMGLQQGGQSYNEARQAGFSPLEALDRGVWQGTAEIIGERFSVPLLQKTFSKYVGKVSNKELGHILADIAVKEQIGEQLTTAFQDAYDKAGIAGLKPNMTLADYLTDAVNTAKVTLMQSVLMSAGAGAGHGVAKAIAQRRPPTPYDVAADAGLNLNPPLTTDTPEQQASKTIGVFRDVAAQYGVHPKVVQGAIDEAKTMPANQASIFLAKFILAVEKRGGVASPIEQHAVDALAAGPIQPEPEMPDHEVLTAPSPENPVKAPAGTAAAENVPEGADAGAKPAQSGTKAAQSETDGVPRETEVAVGPSKLVRTESGWEIQNATPVDAAAHEAASSPTNDRPEPTPAQAEAGNYKKGHARIDGLDISIENPEGSVRRDMKHEPPKWQNEMKGAHYGYIRGTVGQDGEHIDTFIKPGTAEDHAGDVFVIDQTDAQGKPDEHKVMIGYGSEEEARAAYLAHYPKGWNGVGAITPATMEQFKTWLREGDTKKPFAAAKSTAIATTEDEIKPIPRLTDADVARMSHDEIEAMLDKAVEHNKAVDLAGIRKFWGADQAAQAEGWNRRRREKWLTEHEYDIDGATEWLQDRYINDELLKEHRDADANFDIESPAALGRSIAITARKVDEPGFEHSAAGRTVRNAFAFAKQQGWSLDSVVDAMRGRAEEWAGGDAPELFSRLYREAKGKKAANGPELDDVRSAPRLPAPAPAAGRAEPAGGGRAVGPDAAAAARTPGGQPARPAVAGGKPAVAIPDEDRRAAAVAPAAGPRVIGRVGAMPNSAQPLEVRTNKDGTLTPWLDGHELLDFDSGDPVKVPAGATDQEVLDAIKAAGSLGKRQRVFAAEKAEKAPKTEEKPEEKTPRALTDKQAFVDNYAAFEGRTVEQVVQIADSDSTATLKIDAATALRDNDARRKALTDLLGCISRSA